jgi:hypothetical protein
MPRSITTHSHPKPEPQTKLSSAPADKQAQTAAAIQAITEILKLCRVIYTALKNGRVPKGERVLTVRGKRYGLALTHNPTTLVMTARKR